MADPFIGEIHMFGGNFAPNGWATCDGQTLPISQNTALFSLLGTTYGGNGTTNFQLPDLRGRIPIHRGQGAGLTNTSQGDKIGVESVALNLTQLPSHNHGLNGSATAAASRSPVSNVFASSTRAIYAPTSTAVAMASGIIGSTGSGTAHNNLMPYLGLNYIIALQGIFPSRS